MDLKILRIFSKIVKNKPIQYFQLQCNVCNSLFEIRKKYIEWGKKNGKNYGLHCSQKCVMKTLHSQNKGRIPWNKGISPSIEAREKMSKTKRMEKNPKWKGGITRTGEKSQYIAIKSPIHPLKDIRGYVLEHRLIMEKYLGRFLKPNEVIHHINGIKDDNKIENLQLINNQKEHMKIESKGKNNPNYKHGKYIKY